MWNRLSGIFSAGRSRIKKTLLLLLFPLLFSGCAGLVRTEQPSALEWATLSAGQTIGQTFVAKYDGLTGIHFYLSPQQNDNNGEIVLHLRSGPQSDSDLAVSSNKVAIATVKVPGYYSFFIPTQASSNQKYYYAFLEMIGGGNILVGKATGDTYLNGALYQNGTPEDAQAAFQLSYSQRDAFLGLGLEAIKWGGILAIGFFLFILPGWGLFSLLWPAWGRLTWPEKLGLSIGVSLALYPLLLLWTDTIGLHLGALYAWLPPIFGIGMILWRNRKLLTVHAFHHPSDFRLPLADITFIGLAVLIVFTRFWVIRSLDAPLWADSYHHTVITQLLLDHGGLFSSWQPYAELTTFTYHFGFHTAVAVFDWITRMDVTKAVLWVGQILNVLAIIVLYPLATKVGRNRWAGVAAVLLAGLFSPMPMYYVNWGRFTQLAGQVILPAAIYMLWSTMETQPQQTGSLTLPGNFWSNLRSRIPFDTGQMILTWILMGGLALTHYRILIFAVLVIPAFFILHMNRSTWRMLLVQTFWMGLGAGLLFLPWFIRTFAGEIPRIFAAQLTTPSSDVSPWMQQYNSIGPLSSYLPIWFWLLLSFSILLGFWRHEKSVVLIGLWSILILLAANPQWFNLPGMGELSNFAIFIAAYIPASVLAGYLFAQVLNYKLKVKNGWMNQVLALLFFLLILVIGVLGARLRMRDLQVMVNALVTRPDTRASEWIQENTPRDARFLVNSYPYPPTDILGSDAGWWLPILAQRQTTQPPFNYDSEKGPRPDYINWINLLTLEIHDKGISHPDVLALMRERGVTYVYIGQRQGRVNNPGPYVLELEQLLDSPNFRPVYHQDRVWVFEITDLTPR